MTEVLIDIEATIYLIGAILAILIPPMAFIVRAFLAKHRCFKQQERTLAAQASRIESLERHDKNAIKDHDGYDERLRILEDDAREIKIYLKLLLDKEGIKY